MLGAAIPLNALLCASMVAPLVVVSFYRPASGSQLIGEGGESGGSVQAPLGLVSPGGEAVDDFQRLPEALLSLGLLAVLPGHVAGQDTLEDDRQLPVAERDEEVDLGQ